MELVVLLRAEVVVLEEVLEQAVRLVTAHPTRGLLVRGQGRVGVEEVWAAAAAAGTGVATGVATEAETEAVMAEGLAAVMEAATAAETEVAMAEGLVAEAADLAYNRKRTKIHQKAHMYWE